MLEGTLRDNHVISMSSLEDAYMSILTANSVKNIDTSRTCRQKLKQLIQSNVPRVSFTSTRAAIQLIDADTIDLDANMKTLFDAASELREALRKIE